ncbi:CoA ester lyase [Leeia sp.]|uniref:HpcH/HpaI aldolase/citrate lyase family protein n=1 Tax=Leeia sp. TaxID=2884678 RepID=UPI0035B31331
MDVSYLYTPALRVDSVVAHLDSLSTDMVVVDLEDSTHVQAKQDARHKIQNFDFSPIRSRGIKLGLRINTIASHDGLADLQLLKTLYAAGKHDLQTIFLPKVNHPNEVKIYRALLSGLSCAPRLCTFIETVEAVDNADGIASVSDALCFGQADLVSEMYSPNAAFIDYARARLCVAAARHNLQAIDTNSFEIKDMEKFEAECVTAKGYGFTGKAAIHPDQLAGINRVFAVSPEMVSKYQSCIEAYMSSTTGFVIKDGEVIAPPFIAKAKRMLSLYQR